MWVCLRPAALAVPGGCWRLLAVAGRVRYMNSFTYSRIRRTQILSGGTRIKDGMRQFMASLTVEAFDLKLLKPQADELAVLLANAAAAAAAAGGGGGGGGAVGPSSGWGTSGVNTAEQPQGPFGVGLGSAKVGAVRLDVAISCRTVRGGCRKG
jgi:hypothetical protein